MNSVAIIIMCSNLGWEGIIKADFSGYQKNGKRKKHNDRECFTMKNVQIEGGWNMFQFI